MKKDKNNINLNNYPKLLKNYFLQGKNSGSSFILRGKITLVSVMVFKKEKPWSETSLMRYQESMNETARFLEKEAAKYNINLIVDNEFLSYEISEEFNPDRGYKVISKLFDNKSIDEVQRNFEKQFKCNEAPIIIAYDLPGRSYATRQDRDGQYVDEVSTIFRTGQRFNSKIIVHEILHQFGAADFYFPEKIRILANKFLGNSIMDSHNEEVVDDLTAYLVGWKTTVKKNTYKFIKKTMWMSTEEYIKQFDKELGLNSKIVSKNSKI